MNLAKTIPFPNRRNHTGAVRDPLREAEIALQRETNPVKREGIIHNAVAQEVQTQWRRRDQQQHPEKYRAFRRFDAIRRSDDFRAWLVERRLELRRMPVGLPRDLPAEFAIMGAMIADVPGAVQLGLAQLRPPHFTESRFVPILRAVSSLYHRQKRGETEITIWPTTVEIQLMLSGTWLEAGGKKMLKALWHYRCEPSEVPALIEAILEASKLRHLALATDYLSHVAAMDRDESARLINVMRRALDQIEQRGSCDMDALLKESK